MRQELIAARVWELGDEAFGPELGEVVAERAERIAVRRASECLDDVGVDFRGGERITSGNVREAHMPWVIEPQPRDSLSGQGNGRLREPS